MRWRRGTCAFAAPIAYEGTLTSGVPGTGSAGGFELVPRDGANVDYWQLLGETGQTVTITVNRLNATLDPALGAVLRDDDGGHVAVLGESSWGGLTFIGSLDDEHPASLVPGPGGDPFGSFVLPTTGNYTVAIGGASAPTQAVSLPGDDDGDRRSRRPGAFDLGDVHDRPRRPGVLRRRKQA